EMFNIEQSHFIRWYDTEKDIWISAQDTMEVSLKPKQRLVKIIAIGNEQYFRDLGSIVRRNVLALRAVYPNPFARAFTIQYSLPYEARKVTFLVFDLLGKVVWQRDINDIHPGPSMIRVDKMMATGLYVLQMRVIMDDQGSPKVLNRRVMCVR
ncbi:MAG: T9SS type A sorting domain-containing protein, partial [Fibrobacter sp.]|nr:T9SS type A sorting domain-containing protein [Fibrobacter sp.]